jgi:DNA-binding response OmpR family regulator
MAKILIIEDDLVLAGLMCDYLRSESCVVETAATAEEAEKLVETLQYDLMILDMGLAGKSGLQICRRLHRKDTCVPIILLSERPTGEDKSQWFESGVDGYMTRPFSLRELTVRVRALLRHHSGQR